MMIYVAADTSQFKRGEAILEADPKLKEEVEKLPTEQQRQRTKALAQSQSGTSS
jgi:hypothetical protein